MLHFYTYINDFLNIDKAYHPDVQQISSFTRLWNSLVHYECIEDHHKDAKFMDRFLRNVHDFFPVRFEDERNIKTRIKLILFSIIYLDQPICLRS
jgi:hypothetical protein